MKTFVLSMISIAATIAAMTACTSESDEIDEVVEAPEEIRMSAGVLNIVTKSDGPIDALKADITDVAFISKEVAQNQSTAIDWTSSVNTHEATIAGTSGNITFTEATKPYYSSDPAKYTYLIGYHPYSQGTLTSGNVTFNIDGKQDIMYASVVNGNKETNKAETESDKYLKPQFKHLLAQLKIDIQGDQAAAKAWGNITSIQIKNARTELILDVKTGTLSEGTTAVTNIDLIRNDNLTTPISIPTTATSVGYSMIFPQKTQYAVIITTDNVTNKEVLINIPKDDTATPARDANETRAGEAYTITLTFKASEIFATAQVDAWKDVSNGSGTVE